MGQPILRGPITTNSPVVASALPGGLIDAMTNNLFRVPVGVSTNLIVTNLGLGQVVSIEIFPTNGFTVTFPQQSAGNSYQGWVKPCQSNQWNVVHISRLDTAVTNFNVQSSDSLFPDGSTASPSIFFSSDRTMGFRRSSSSTLAMVFNASDSIVTDGSLFRISSDTASGRGFAIGATAGTRVQLGRDGSGLLSQVNDAALTAPQTNRIVGGLVGSRGPTPTNWFGMESGYDSALGWHFSRALSDGSNQTAKAYVLGAGNAMGNGTNFGLKINTDRSVDGGSNFTFRPMTVEAGLPYYSPGFAMLTLTNPVIHSNTLSVLNLISNYSGTATIPANVWRGGMSAEISYEAYYFTPASPANHTNTVAINGTAIATNVMPYMNSVSGDAIHGRITITCRSPGASGKFYCQGMSFYPSAAGGASSVGKPFRWANGEVTIDTTTATTISLTEHMGTTTCGITVNSLVIKLQ